MAVGLIVALALTGVVAGAQEWVTGTRTVTVNLPKDTQEATAGDIATADVVLDIYRIGFATASDTHETYDLKGATDKLDAALKAGDWSAMANVALDEVKAGSEAIKQPYESFEVGETIKLGEDASADGIFLILPHGKDQQPTSLKAFGRVYEYTFSPSIVTLPTKDNWEEGQAINSAYGNWSTEGKAVLKFEPKHRFGDLVIGKQVQRFNGDPQTFVFHLVAVEGETEKPDVYENYASVYYDKSGVATTKVTHIPADITVKVEEVYTGAHDEKSAGNEAQFVEIKGGETVELAKTFENEPGDNVRNGHGIENKFKMQANGDWHWNATPESEAEGDEVVNAHQDAAGEAAANDQSAETK